MNTKKVIKSIKSIVSVGLGALMVVGTIYGAMATTIKPDLKNYPNMFIEDGQLNAVLVVGAGAKAEDVIGITNIATSLQTAAVTTETTQIDDSLRVSEGYQLCNRNDYLGTSIADCEPSIDDSDVDFLADHIYHDSEGDNDNDEKYTQQLSFNDGDTGQFVFMQDDDDAPTAGAYLFLDNTQNYLYNYELSFDSSIDVDGTSSSTATDDLQGTVLNLQGAEFTITNAKISGGELTQFDMQGSSTGAVWMSEGESITRTVDGVAHEIELMDVSADTTSGTGSCGFNIDGTEVWIDVTDTETVNGIQLGVIDAKRVNMEAQSQDICDVVVGALKLSITDNNEVKFNNEEVQRSHGEIMQSGSGSSLQWTGFNIDWSPETAKIYMAAGDEFIDPILGQFKFVFAGVETGGTETIDFDMGGSSGVITFKNEDGTLVELPLSASSSSQVGEATNEPTYWGDKAPVSSDANRDELVYLQGETCTGSVSVSDCQGAQFLVVEPTKDEAHLIEITNIDTNNNQISFDDLTYGTSDDDESYTDESSNTLSLKSAGNVGIFINETAKTITWTDIGSTNGADIKTENRGTVELVNVDTTNQQFEGLRFSEFNDGSLPDAEYVGADSSPMNITAVYDDSVDNSMEIESSSVNALTSDVGSGFYDESDDNNDDQVFMTYKGTLVTYDNKDNKRLTIEHPYDTAYAKVYIAPTDAEVGANTVTQTTVNAISVASVKLDSEIKSVDKQNIIAVGGPCANSVVAELMGEPANCMDMGIKSGQALIKLFENGNYVALVVAGQDAMDTRLAAQIVANWEDYDLSGNEMIATTVSESSLSVKEK